MDSAQAIPPDRPAPRSPTTVHIDLAAITRLRTRRDGGRDVELGSVRGWAVGPESLARIDVFLGDRLVSTARIGDARPDVASLFPEIEHAGRAGFEAILTSGRLGPTESDVVLKLQTAGGRSLSVTYPLSFTQGDADLDAFPIRMAVDSCTVDSQGQLHLAGWALAEAQIVAIQVFAGADHIATTVPARPRPDVALTFPAYPNSENCGFDIARLLPLQGGAAPERVRIEVIARDGSARSMAAPVRLREALQNRRTPPPAIMRGPMLPAPGLHFNCDAITLTPDGVLCIEGWALARPSIKEIAISVGGSLAGTAQIGLPRPDVRRAFPGFPIRQEAGFSARLAVAGLLTGDNAVDFVLSLEDGSQHRFRETAIATAMLADPGSAAIEMAVDGMQIEAGHAARRVSGAFHLVGWAAAQAGVASVEAFLDDTTLGMAYHGLRRDDVAAAYPHLPNSLRAGFALSVPSRALNPGRSQIRVVVTDREGARAETSFTVDIDLSARANKGPPLRSRMSAAETAVHLAVLAARGPLPTCDLALRIPAGRDAAQRAMATLESLIAQGHDAWRLWPFSGSRQRGDTIRKALCAAHPDHADRIRTLDDYEPVRGPALAGLLEAGDILAVDSLLVLAIAATGPDPADLVYGDDIRPDPADLHPAAFFKPDWSPDLLLSQNYIGRAWLAREGALVRAGLDLPAVAACGAYGALLRLTEIAGGIGHVPQLVLQAGRSRESVGLERRALAQALRRRGIAGTVGPGPLRGVHRVRRRAMPCAKVSIIIPTIAAKGHVRTCIESIRRLTRGIAYEIILVDNLRGGLLSPEQRAWKAWFRGHADLVVSVDEDFNWSRLNNLGAEVASGDLLLFLNDDVEVRDPDWLAVLAAEAARPEVGVVGARLLYPDGKVQHAGMILSRATHGHASHAFRFAAPDESGYFSLALSQRNVACVTGACMMLRREVFEASGGFDEAHGVVNNDVDFCLRLHSAGKLIVYTPHVCLTHHELASRAVLVDTYDRSAFLARWADLFLAGDPFHNRNLADAEERYAIEEEPLREVYAGHPLGSRAGIKRILAVKLDHIGDLVTALPALRRLKAHFPAARLDALVGPSALAIAGLEPAIDEIIPFAFFEARSSLGRKALGRQDYAALEATLKARRYDLAIDLRKLGDTRQVLQLTHAPVLAGFDHGRSFPWLDIALEWEGDPLQARKRNHVADDLINLADAVANAFGEERRTIGHDARLPALSRELDRDFGPLFAHGYVVIHPAAGTALRQWPPAHFAKLIDLLVERDGMRIALVGGPDERDIADDVLRLTKHAGAVFDLVGRSRLAELPEILARSVLFVGNNSGPSHLAAGLGVPTIAVHSAIVASEEWGPLGPVAVALRRDMSCAPCYIVSVDQCHRGMACLTTITPPAVHAVCRRFLALRAGRNSRANPTLEVRHGCDA